MKKSTSDKVTIEDGMLMNLPESNQWRTCPNCHISLLKNDDGACFRHAGQLIFANS